MKKTNMNHETTNPILRVLNKLSFGVLRLELIAMVGIIGVCVFKAGTIFLV